MNFVVAISPKQYFLGIIGFVILVVGFVAWDNLIVATTPEEEKYSRNLRPVVHWYKETHRENSELTARNKSAVLRKDINTVTITPNDFRVRGDGKIEIKNVTDQVVSSVSYRLALRSKTLGTNFLQIQPIKNFDPHLKPNETAVFDIRLNSLAMMSLKHEKDAPQAKVSDFVGAHNVSNVDITIEAFKVAQKLPSYIGVAPDGLKLEAEEQFKEKVDECWPYFKTLFDSYGKEKLLNISEKNLKKDRVCLDKIRDAYQTLQLSGSL